MTSKGQKVTTDPRSNQAIHEGVGVVTSDSLAAESLKGSGSFGEGNPHAAASKQPSKSTTTNTTDTSGATTLPPAVDAEAREAQQGWSETRQLNAATGLGKNAGVGPTYNTPGATTSATGGLPSTGAAGSTAVPLGGGVSGGYAGAADSARAAGELKPKGVNLQEGGFDGATRPNPEIGSKNDPGRAAESKFQLSNAQPGGATGGGRQGEVTGNSVYDKLNNEENA
ncbi:hypothetical protein B0J11DRAFT_521181 [Dendryphion nanum]|uniref:Uncharacterized protein n=1 Tax=Dendryphion nanum TaxID=256645 RepID=A0A9P9E947_9PLEO|nr:hypothetical protein B0J11DRAFT_521181 [Dendryphion nanum]